jgi:tetratricopeptide (TPR) repeat protein
MDAFFIYPRCSDHVKSNFSIHPEVRKMNHLKRQVPIYNVSWLQDMEDMAVTESERLAVEGYNAASREEYEDAVDYFTKAIRLIHNDHRFYGNRSFCYCQLGQYVK